MGKQHKFESKKGNYGLCGAPGCNQPKWATVHAEPAAPEAEPRCICEDGFGMNLSCPIHSRDVEPPAVPPTQERARQAERDISCLVDRFASALKDKLLEAELKYNWNGGWRKPGWADDLRRDIRHHVEKGDPRDVAAYCAFAWHHGWSLSTEPVQPSPQPASAEPITHKRNCAAWINEQGQEVNGEDCTCGYRWRIEIQTLHTLKSAWEKRAYEAEDQLAALHKSHTECVEALKQELQAKADTAYCDYIAQMGRIECLGFEAKLKDGTFGRHELTAHTTAATLLGRHQAFAEVRDALANAAKLGDKEVGNG